MKYVFCTEFVLLLFAVCAQAAETPAVIEIQVSGICTANFSPDGMRVVTAEKDKTASVWDAKTGEKLRALQHAGRVHTAVFSPDGKKIATSCDDKIVRIWDADLGLKLHQLEGLRPCFSPDGKKIVTVNYGPVADISNLVRIWDTETGKELNKLEGHINSIWVTVFSPDGKKLATSGYDNTIRLWDVDSSRELQQWQGRSVAFSPDGKGVATNVHRERLVKIWDVESGKESQRLEGHEGFILSVAFAPDGKSVITTSDDETARIWDAESGKEIKKLQGDPNDRLDWKDGKWNGQMWGGKLGWSVGGQSKEGSPASVRFEKALFFPDGKHVLTTGDRWDRGLARIWSVETGQQVQWLVGYNAEGSSAPFSPDGKKIVNSDCTRFFRIWDWQRIPERPAIMEF